MNDSKKLLISGHPGVGKTTLVKKVASALQHLRPMGFCTEEIRSKGERHGFELVDFAGRRQVLSHIDFKGRPRVGKYGVDVAGFDSYLETLNLSETSSGVIIIDEIGRMESLSGKFRSTIISLLDSPYPVLATIAEKGAGLISEVRSRPDVRIFELTVSNRDQMVDRLVAAITSAPRR